MDEVPPSEYPRLLVTRLPPANIPRQPGKGKRLTDSVLIGIWFIDRLILTALHWFYLFNLIYLFIRFIRRRFTKRVNCILRVHMYFMFSLCRAVHSGFLPFWRSNNSSYCSSCSCCSNRVGFYFTACLTVKKHVTILKLLHFGFLLIFFTIVSLNFDLG